VNAADRLQIAVLAGLWIVAGVNLGVPSKEFASESFDGSGPGVLKICGEPGFDQSAGGRE
jgi:hypothetical protein